MEDNFNQNDFEEFLKEQVRNHRMYPKDSVWRQINQKLHGDKRWPGLTVAAFLLVASTVAICLHFSPEPNIFSIKPSLKPITAAGEVSKGDNNKIVNGLASTHYNRSTTKVTSKGDVLVLTKDAADLNEVDDASIVESSISDQSTNTAERITKATATLASVNTSRPIENNAAQFAVEGITSVAKSTEAKSLAPLQVTSAPAITAENPATETKKLAKAPAPKTEDVAVETSTSLIRKSITRQNKFSLLFYVAPSVSYRKMYEDNALTKTNNGGPIGINYVADVNDVVRHKPATGIEAGVSVLYNLAPKFRIKSGIQFNVRQYGIEAYKATTEISSIALVGSNRVDTINTLTTFRNNNGYRSAELRNRYYQFSVPIGIEWEVVGNKRVQLNVAASIQPTYLLNRNAYLLTTNFKNYTEKEEMVRHFNINSNIETFVSLVVGDFKWQLGPQIRYQPYSTYIKAYPIKEHLIDYGIKLGVSTRLK